MSDALEARDAPGSESPGAPEPRAERPKDFWDKAATISGVMSSVLIAGFGLYFNHTSQESQRKLDELLGQQQLELAVNQNRLRELEVVEGLLPHLAGGETTEDRKKLALVAIRHLGNEEIATEFAEVLGGRGATAALTHIARTAESAEERERAEAALTRLTMGVGGGDAVNPDAETIIDRLNSLEGGTDHFAILKRGEQRYLQTIGGPDEFQLEYRDGSAEKHFGCTATKDEVIRAFQSYAREGDDAWRSVCAWKKMRF